MSAKKYRPVVSLRGENNGNAALNREQVRSIREQVRDGVPRKVVAKQYGVSVSVIAQIMSRRLWDWLPDTPIVDSNATVVEADAALDEGRRYH
jgi:hypothetical protein